MTKDLQTLTKKAKQAEMSAETMTELRNQFLVAKSLQLPSDQLQEPQKILNDQNKHEETVS